jgi:sugar/nucleoside kinase (ribokinase family)
MPEIAIVGELNPDLILQGLPYDLPVEREHLASGFTMTLGSSSAILAHNLALLGTRVYFVTQLGNDLFGRFCREMLTEVGVELEVAPPRHKGLATGVTVILPHAEGRRILTYPGTISELGRADLDVDRLARARHFHLSSLYLQRRLLPDCPALFSEMKDRGLSTSLDTNDDPDDRWGPPLAEILPHVDVFFCNERELCRLTGSSDVDSAAQSLEKKVKILVVKRGAAGASAYQAGMPAVHVPGVPVEHVVDPVGAGDTFAAGFLHRWLRGHDVTDSVRYGNLTGALSVTRAGGVEAFRQREHAKAFFERAGAVWP